MSRTWARAVKVLSVKGVAAEHDEVGVQLRGDAIERGTRGMEVDRNSHAVKGVLAVVAADEKQRLGVEALAEDLGKGFADPLQTGLVGGVIKGKHQNGLRAGRGLAQAPWPGAGGEARKESRCRCGFKASPLYQVGSALRIRNAGGC